MILRLVFSFFFFSLVTGNQRIPRPEEYYEEDTHYADKTICFTPSMVHRMVKAALKYVSLRKPTEIPSDANKIINYIDQELNTMSNQDSVEDHYVRRPSNPFDSKTIFKMVHKPTSETRTNLVLKYELPGAQEPQCKDALERLIEIASNAYLELDQHPQCSDYLYRFASQQTDDRPNGHIEHGPDIKSLIASILEEVDRHSGKPRPVHNRPEYNIDTAEIDIPIPEYQVPHSPDIQIQEYNIPQINEYNVPKSDEYTIKTIHEYNIPQTDEYTIKKVHEYTNPEINEYTIKKIHEYSIPEKDEYLIQKIPQFISPQSNEINIQKKTQYNIPESDEYTIHKHHVMPQSDEYTINKHHIIPQSDEYTINKHHIIPQSDEYTIHKHHVMPQSDEYTIHKHHVMPQSDEYTINKHHIIPQSDEYTINKHHIIPQSDEYTIHKHHVIPQTDEYTIQELHYVPQIQKIHVQEIDIPETRETTEEIIKIQPKETLDILTKLLDNNDQPNNDLDRFMDIVAENPDNFQPQIFNILTTLMNSHKHRNIPKVNDILLLLLDSERNKKPWSEKITDNILSYLIPDHNGYVDTRIVDIILNLYRKPTGPLQIEYILSLLKHFKEGNLDSRILDIILNLINANQNNLLVPEHIDVLLKLLKPSHNGAVNDKEVEIIDNLLRWKEIGLSPQDLEAVLHILRPNLNGLTDHRNIDIVHFLLNKIKHVNPNHLHFILKFLHPENEFVKQRHTDIIHFLLNSRLPVKHVNIILALLQENAHGVHNTRFLDILMFLANNRLLTPELLETVTALLIDEITGRLDDDQVKSFVLQLKQSHPKFVVDVLTILTEGGFHDNIIEWFKRSNDLRLPNHDNQYRTPDGGYQTKDDFMTFFKWLDSQGLLNPNQGASSNEINKLLKILEMGERELGAVELTYMLKHEKPLIYQPVYYVKYRLPILSFISNMKTLITANPQLTTNPMKLLQELIVISNVTEVSPNLQGFPKEEILKLTFNEGDLVQAKILDEQNLNLNEQIRYVHGLNADISPEEILQLNRLNEAKYYPTALQFRETYPESKVTVHEVEKIVELPTVKYQFQQVIPQHSHALQFIERTNKEIPQQDNNGQLQSNEKKV